MGGMVETFEAAHCSSSIVAVLDDGIAGRADAGDSGICLEGSDVVD